MPRARTVAVAGAAAVAAWPFAEPHLPVLRRRSVPVLPPGARPLRVLHLSDLHLVPGQRRKTAWVTRLGELRPDLVVATGDHLSSVAAIEPLVELYRPFAAAGAVSAFVPGNNDYYTPVPVTPRSVLRHGPPAGRTPDLPWERAAALLVAAGWLDLTHRRTEVEVGGTRLLLTGTDDGFLGRDRYARVAGAVPAGVLGIGVTHTPQQRLLAAFAADGYRLVLAGHTHGGQVRLPGVGALTSNCDLPRERARGLSYDGGGWLHVSAGLGSSPYLPVRLCCRPEATLLTLHPHEPGRSAGGRGGDVVR